MVNGFLSTRETNFCEEPQGTYKRCLYHLVFNTKMNGINSLSLNGKLVCSTDDTVLIIIGDT